MTTGKADPNYHDLTAMLHLKSGSDAITVGQLDDINNSICKTDGASADPAKLICKLVAEEAKACLGEQVVMNLENKIVLTIAIRLGAERFMIDRIARSHICGGNYRQSSAGLNHEIQGTFSRRSRNDHNAGSGCTDDAGEYSCELVYV